MPPFVVDFLLGQHLAELFDQFPPARAGKFDGSPPGLPDYGREGRGRFRGPERRDDVYRVLIGHVTFVSPLRGYSVPLPVEEKIGVFADLIV